MKRELLAFAMMIGMVSMTQAQSLMIANHDQETMVNSTYVGDYGSHIEVKNITGSAVSVMCKRQLYTTNLCAFDSTYFCWDFCYPPGVNVSNGAMSIDPGVVNKLFSGHVYSSIQGMSCSDSIRYTFYVQGNPNDSVSAVLKYTAGPNVSVDENTSLVSNAYPNPANVRFFIELENTPNNAVVEFYNLLGSKVKVVDVNNVKTEVNVSDLKSGIYLYTVSSNGQALETKKMVVKH